MISYIGLVLFVPVTHSPICLCSSGGSSASGTNSPFSLSVSEHASTIKSEPNMVPSPHARQAVASMSQVSPLYSRILSLLQYYLQLIPYDMLSMFTVRKLYGSNENSIFDVHLIYISFIYLILSLKTSSHLDSAGSGHVDIKYEDYPFTPASIAPQNSWCALSQA